jgi:hypothetical protein
MLSDQVLSSVSGSRYFEYKETPFPHTEGYADTWALDTVNAQTRDIAGDSDGFGGPFNMLISVSTEGRVRGLHMLASHEMPDYITDIDAWLKNFKDIDIIHALPLAPHNVDAGITAEAIVQIFNKACIRIREDLLGFEHVLTTDTAPRMHQKFLHDYRFYVILLLSIMSVLSFLKGNRKSRLVMLAINTVFFGIMLNMLLTFFTIGSFSIGIIPGSHTIWVLFFIIILLISVGWGQAYCGYMCPFGAVQEFFSFFKLTRHMNPGISDRARYIKYLVLGAGLVFFWVSGSPQWLTFCPMHYAFGAHWNIWMVMGIGLIGVCSLFYFRFWCRYFCPAGAFLSFFNKINLLGALARKRNFSRCDLGVKEEKDIDCIKCNRCITQES